MRDPLPIYHIPQTTTFLVNKLTQLEKDRYNCPFFTNHWDSGHFMIDINHDETSIMGLFLSNHSWSRTHTGALSSAGNMCVYIQSQLTTDRDRGSFLCKGRRPTEAPSSRPTSLERLNCERLVALLRRGTSTTAANVALPPHCFPHLRHWAGWAQVLTWQKEKIASWILNAIIAAHLARFRGYQYHIKTSCKRHGNFEQLFHPPL